ncbi:hypothetical protein [uncultured Micrococcus sp.]|uniref:hypothetical protein n=1 Tax=uncultured Micrococcus sp. TaxID=114051 RepID=UPI002625F4B4|nr:hypothetical protein [uncultured Micrococcus sp.]
MTREQWDVVVAGGGAVGRAARRRGGGAGGPRPHDALLRDADAEWADSPQGSFMAVAGRRSA